MLAAVMHSPLMYYGLLATGLAACLYLFVSQTVKMRAQQCRALVRERELAARLQAAEAEAGGLSQRLRELEDQAGLLAPPTPMRPALNLSTRSQALRMFRRGDRPDQIAAALGIPEREVELLVKVQRIILNVPLPDAGPHS